MDLSLQLRFARIYNNFKANTYDFFDIHGLPEEVTENYDKYSSESLDIILSIVETFCLELHSSNSFKLNKNFNDFCEKFASHFVATIATCYDEPFRKKYANADQEFIQEKCLFEYRGFARYGKLFARTPEKAFDC